METSEIGPGFSLLRLQLFKTSDTVRTDEEISLGKAVFRKEYVFWIYHD